MITDTLGTPNSYEGEIPFHGRLLERRSLVSFFKFWIPKRSQKPIPRPPKVCFLEVFSYLKPTKKHTFGGPGSFSWDFTLKC